VVQTVLDTVFAVQQGYWDLVFRVQDLGAKRESQKLAEDFLAENKIRVELGTLAPIELVQAATQSKRSEGDVIVAEAAVREAEDKLKETLNIAETLSTWRLRLQPTDTPPFTPIAEIPVEEKVLSALQNRPDVVQSQLTIASQEIARDVARNQRLPRVDLQGAASVNAFSNDAGSTLSGIGDAEGYQWTLSLKFTYPLGNRAANNELQRQNLLLQQALVDQRKIQRTVVRQIFQTVRDVETLSKRVEVTRAATVLARTQLEAEQEKFRLGLSTSFNVLQFQSQLTTARSDETRALSDYNVALGKLDQVTGTLQYGAKQ
jgi:outer membrane protein TolC